MEICRVSGLDKIPQNYFWQQVLNASWKENFEKIQRINNEMF